MYAMPVERIIHYFEDQGFNLKKPTAGFPFGQGGGDVGKLLQGHTQGGAQRRLHRFGRDLLQDTCPGEELQGKGVKKGYFWVIVGQKSGLLYVVYRDGSRAGDVIYDELHDYHGTMHSDAASFYRKIQATISQI